MIGSTVGIVLGDVTDLDAAYFWILFLVAYDIVFIVAATWTFESVVVE